MRPIRPPGERVEWVEPIWREIDPTSRTNRYRACYSVWVLSAADGYYVGECHKWVRWPVSGPARWVRIGAGKPQRSMVSAFVYGRDLARADNVASGGDIRQIAIGCERKWHGWGENVTTVA